MGTNKNLIFKIGDVVSSKRFGEGKVFDIRQGANYNYPIIVKFKYSRIEGSAYKLSGSGNVSDAFDSYVDEITLIKKNYEM